MTPADTNVDPKKFFFGNYEIVDTTGSGGMGVVYRAIDMQLGRPVALKILRDELRSQEHIVARFQREAEAIATLNHPNIVHVYSVGAVGKIPYLAMEFIEGTTLGNLLAEHGPMGWHDALGIAAQISEALASAHDCGIIHRDIKPGNILLDPTGKAYVTDFGIAKVLHATTKLTVDGSRLGTPQYMSPERCKNKEITPASDIYSLGVLLYQSICGRLPYEANSPVELLAKITGEDPVRISEYAPDIPENVDRLLAHMLDPNPKSRPQSARTLLTLIERVQKGLPLEERDDSNKALRNYRVQLEKESPARTPQPKAETPRVSLRARITRGWFTLPRAARLLIAGTVTLLAATALAIGGWQTARIARPLAIRMPNTDAATWRTPATPFTVTQETKGVSVIHLTIPALNAIRVVAIAGTNNIGVELAGGDNASYALAELSTATTRAELVIAPTFATTPHHALTASTGDAGATQYVFPLSAQLPPNTTAAQPLADGRWAVAHYQAGIWSLDITDANGKSQQTFPLPAGPVTALAIAPNGYAAAYVTGATPKKTLWQLALSTGAKPTELAHGEITLSPQAFTSDSAHLVAAVKESPSAASEVHLYTLNASQPATLGKGSYAAAAPHGDGMIMLAPDDAGRTQLWQIVSTGGTATQLTFLGTGLGDTLAVTANGFAAAPVAGQPAAALVALAQ